MKNPCKKYFLYLIVFLGLLSAFGAFVIDMYFPALPEMAEVFHCETSVVQFGLTFCMVGLAMGQLLFGPASDKYGRRPILLLTLFIFVGASLICCLSISISVFIAARFLQGIGGAGGIVLSRSIAADIYSGRELAKLIAILSAINNIAPTAAPVAGGGVAHAWGWQGIFVVLLALGGANCHVRRSKRKPRKSQPFQGKSRGFTKRICHGVKGKRVRCILLRLCFVYGGIVCLYLVNTIHCAESFWLFRIRILTGLCCQCHRISDRFGIDIEVQNDA